MRREGVVERYQYRIIENDQVFEGGRRDDPVETQATQPLTVSFAQGGETSPALPIMTY
jgi:hypothetical protein